MCFLSSRLCAAPLHERLNVNKVCIIIIKLLWWGNNAVLFAKVRQSSSKQRREAKNKTKTCKNKRVSGRTFECRWEKFPVCIGMTEKVDFWVWIPTCLNCGRPKTPEHQLGKRLKTSSQTGPLNTSHHVPSGPPYARRETGEKRKFSR